MRFSLGLGLAGLLLAPALAPDPAPNPTPTAAEPAAGEHVTVWTDRDNPYDQGDAARVFVRLPRRAYLTVVRVDTDGRIRVLFPRDPWNDNYAAGGRAFEVRAERTGGAFLVDDYPGVGYVFALTSAVPFDYDPIVRDDRWDYRSLNDGRIEGDPYVALTALANRLVPEGRFDYDVMPYYVGRRYDYPRFACYQCHAYASYYDWDPYTTPCTRYRVVIYDDPVYYPYRRFGARAVVVQRPERAAPRFVFRDRSGSTEYVTEVRGRGSRRPAERLGAGEVRVPTPVADRAAPDLPVRRSVERPSGGRDLAPGQRDTPPVRAPADRTPPSRRVEPRSRPERPQSTGEPELRRRHPVQPR